jgi:CRISPR-associated protein Csm4
MMNVESWKIIPKGLSGFHFGTHGMAQERSSVVYHSDSLFSAIILTLSTIAGSVEVEKHMQEFSKSQPPFLLSSAFPFAGDVRFYPLPLSSLREAAQSGQPNLVRMKELKGIKFISERAFERLLADPASLAVQYRSGKILQGGLLVLAEEVSLLPRAVSAGEQRIFDNLEKRPRVTIGRADSASNLFFTGAVRFAHECGLWFAIRWLKEESRWRKSLPESLAALQDEGLGGDRSSGFGQVQIEPWKPLKLPVATGKPWVTLSRYIPQKAEIASFYYGPAGFAFDRITGWMRSPGNPAQRRKSVQMLREGSTFGALDQIPLGRIVEVQPEYWQGHPIYRSGLAFGVGFTEEVQP